MAEAAVEVTRPLPRLDEPDTAPFWEAACEGRLVYPVCRGCGAIVFYPRRHCTACTSLDLEWRESAGRGTVYTFTVVRQHGHEYFRSRVPYVVAFIDLDDGFRMLAEVVGVEPEAVEVGQRVRLEWEEHEQARVPLFRAES